MWCVEVRDRLVAWADGELSPGEATQVEAHVRTCATCARHDAALRGVTPRPRLVRPPPEVMRRLDRALDVDVLLARAAREPAPEALAVRMQRFLRHETSVPRAGVLAYAALLLFAVSVAAVGWWGAAPAPTVADVPSTLPSEQYEPASFRPSAGPAPAPDDAGADGAGFR
jgi:anti-sigma factor RsiW